MRFFLQAFRLVMLNKGNYLKKLKNLGGESWRCQAKEADILKKSVWVSSLSFQYGCIFPFDSTGWHLFCRAGKNLSLLTFVHWFLVGWLVGSGSQRQTWGPSDIVEDLLLLLNRWLGKHLGSILNCEVFLLLKLCQHSGNHPKNEHHLPRRQNWEGHKWGSMGWERKQRRPSLDRGRQLPLA